MADAEEIAWIHCPIQDIRLGLKKLDRTFTDLTLVDEAHHRRERG
jgi:hypothetical protein